MIAHAKQREDSVATPSMDYGCQAKVWQMIHDLLGGTPVMREAAESWLPREEKEEERAYQARLDRTFLYNGYGNTIDRLTAKPFSKPVIRQGEIGPELEAVEKNVDKAGTSMGEFARGIFKSALKYGRAHVLVDYTQIPQGSTKADEKNLGARPSMILVEAPDLIGWRTEIGPDGVELTQVRIKECRTEAEGTYIDKKTEYIRVFTKTEWELWKRLPDKDGEEVWEKVQNGTHTFRAVPFFIYYMKQTGFMQAECPLEDLAWINIRHWQSSSEQNSVLRIARIGILFGRGFTEDEVKNGIVIGPNHMIMSESKEADLKYVEHQGQAIKAGQDDLDKLEARMEVLGLKPVVERNSNSTFGGKLIDEMATHSNIQAWVRLLESFLLECMQAAARWMSKTIPEGIKYDIYSDFGLQAADAVHLDALLKACIAGKITDKTFLEEYKRRAVLSEQVKVGDELRGLEEAKAKDQAAQLKLAEAGKTPDKTAPPTATS